MRKWNEKNGGLEHFRPRKFLPPSPLVWIPGVTVHTGVTGLFSGLGTWYTQKSASFLFMTLGVLCGS